MSKRQKRNNHNQLVSGVLAAALAFTAVVSSVQLANVSDDLAANVSGRYVAQEPPPPDGGGGTCPDGSPMPADGACPPPPGGDGTGGSNPSDFTGNQSGCTSAGFQWCSQVSDCFPQGQTCPAAGGGGTETQCSAGQHWDAGANACVTDGGAAPGSECGPGYYWDGSACKTSGDAAGSQCGQNQWWDYATSSCKPNNYTQANCTADGGTWRAGTNGAMGWCDNSGQNHPGGNCPAGSTPDSYGGCMQDSMNYDNRTEGDTGTCPSWDYNCQQRMRMEGGDMTERPMMPVRGFVSQDPASYGRTGDEGGCWNAGYYWHTFPDGRGDCFPDEYSIPYDADAIFTDDIYNRDCAPWDMYCQRQKESGKLGQEDPWAQSEDAECLSAAAASRQQVEIRQQIKELEYNFSTIDLGNAADMPVVADMKKVKDKLKQVDLDDPCEIGKAWRVLGDIHGEDGLLRQVENQQQFVEFRKELGRIEKEIKREESIVRSERGKELLGKAKAKVAELKENPPYDPDDPGSLWDALDPECMRFMPPMPMSFPGGGATGGVFPGGGATGGEFPGGGHFGGPGFSCTIDELIASDTPRGYFEASIRTDDEENRAYFANNMCEEAKRHLKEFREFVLPNLTGEYKTMAEDILKRGAAMVVKCEEAKDNKAFAPKFNELGRKAEKLMSEAGVDFSEFFDGEGGEDFGRDFRDMGGLANLTGEDLMAKIDAIVKEKVKAAIGEVLSEFERKMTKVFEEQFSKLAVNISGSILDEVSTHLSKVKEDVGERILSTLDYASSLDPERRADNVEAYEEKTERTAAILTTLDSVVAIDDETEREVEDLQELITDPLVPISVLAQVESVVRRAETVAKNGGDAATELERAVGVVEAIDKDEMRRLAHEEGLAPFADLDISSENRDWYKDYAVEAYGKGVLDGATTDLGRELQAGKTLNVAEGITMIAKTAGLEPRSNVDPRIAAAVPDSASWSEGYMQAVADKIGADEVLGAIEEAGSVAEPMHRKIFADIAVEVYEAEVGRQDADESRIRSYDDYGDLDNEGRHNFAVANELGMITGADGGRFANPDGEANRAEAAKMLSVYRDAMEGARIEGGVDVNFDINDDAFWADVDVEGDVNIGSPNGN